MGDLTSKKLIYLKAALFLLGGFVSAILILAEQPNLKVAALLAISIWCFCRFYYFAFYVIQHYVDGDYKFAGLWQFVKYICGRNDGPGSDQANH